MSDTNNIHTAMCAVLSEIGGIAKDKRNQQQGFQYRGIDQVYSAVQPLFAKHGIYCTSEILDRWTSEKASKSGGALFTTVIKIRYHFRHKDGSSVATEVIGEGMDSGDKSGSKSLAIAHKYAILQALCVPTEVTDDPDAQSHEVAPEPPKRPEPELKPTTFLSIMVLPTGTKERSGKDKDGTEFTAWTFQLTNGTSAGTKDREIAQKILSAPGKLLDLKVEPSTKVKGMWVITGAELAITSDVDGGTGEPMNLN